MATFAEDLVGYNFAARLGERSRLRGRLTFKDAAACKRAALVLRPLIELGKVALANGPRKDILELLQNLSLSEQDQDLVFDVEVSKELLKTITTNNRQQQERFRDRRQRQQDKAAKDKAAPG
jgi:hypothetical protein